MHYHIILTERCNSQCRYCYKKSMEEFDNKLSKEFTFEDTPIDSQVSTESLKNFLKPGDTLIFYGGEPLLQIEKIKQLIDELAESKIRFCIQTNGKLLNELPKEYLLKLDKILISLDGNKEITDKNKGIGTYDKVIQNIKLIREKGFKNEIVARMVVSQDSPDIYEQAKHLTSLIEEKLIDSLHWQIDAGFYENDFKSEKFKHFTKEYNVSLSLLIDFWIENMKKGKVLKFYPFLGIFESLYYNKPMKMQCGSGHSNYTITTSGKLSACPIINSMKEFYAGDLETPECELKKFEVKEPCASCRHLKCCGGRCLYWNYTKLWPQEGDKLICSTVRHLIEEIELVLPTIKRLIQENKVSEKDFEFERYFGPEIIP